MVTLTRVWLILQSNPTSITPATSAVSNLKLELNGPNPAITLGTETATSETNGYYSQTIANKIACFDQAGIALRRPGDTLQAIHAGVSKRRKQAPDRAANMDNQTFSLPMQGVNRLTVASGHVLLKHSRRDEHLTWQGAGGLLPQRLAER